MSKTFGLFLFSQLYLFSNELQRSKWPAIHTIVITIIIKMFLLWEHGCQSEHIID